MAYVNQNFKTKKAFKQSVKNGDQHMTYNPSDMFSTTKNGTATIEGPHYPQPHKWYATVTVQGGYVVKVH